MRLEDTVAFVTGANRGLGRALVEGLLARGARRVYAASRDGELSSYEPRTRMARGTANVAVATPDDVPQIERRVIPVKLDVTDPNQARAVAAAAPDVTLLINNAGSLSAHSVLHCDAEALKRDLDVNYYGVLNVTRAFVPGLSTMLGASILNILSIVSIASMPGIGGYSASKAAAWSLTQSLRGELRERGIRVHAAFPGPMDTEMARGFDFPKAEPLHVAREILDGLEAGREDIAPCAMSADAFATFERDPREIERRFGS